jgi:hypothetical protein
MAVGIAAGALAKKCKGPIAKTGPSQNLAETRYKEVPGNDGLFVSLASLTPPAAEMFQSRRQRGAWDAEGLARLRISYLRKPICIRPQPRGTCSEN